MLTLDVTRKELESRIQTIIEDFNGSKLGRKHKTLSLLNQSLKTLLHGNDSSQSTTDLKNNEHNLDSFFSSSSNNSYMETEESYTLTESYHYKSYDNSIRTTNHKTEYEAQLYLHKDLVSDYKSEIYNLIMDFHVNDILSYLSDKDREKLDELLEDSNVSIKEVPDNFDACHDFIESVEHVGNVRALGLLANLLIDSDEMSGTHSIERNDIQIEVREIDAPKKVQMLAFVVSHHTSESRHLVNKQYMSVNSHSEEVKKMYLDIVKERMGHYSEAVSNLLTSELVTEPEMIQLKNSDLSSVTSIISAMATILPVEKLLSREFIRDIAPNHIIKVKYNFKTEIV